MVAKAIQLFAKPIYKLIARGAGQTGRKSKVISHYEYGGKKYQLKDLIEVQRHSEKRRPVRGYIPKEEEAERIAKLGTEEKVFSPVKKRETAPAVLKQLEKLDELTNDELRYLSNKRATEEFEIPYGRLASYRQGRLGAGMHGQRTRFVDESGRRVHLSKFAEEVNELNDRNFIRANEVLSKITASSEGEASGTSLLRHLGRMLKYAKYDPKFGKTENEIIDKFVSLDAPWWGNFLAKRGRLNKREIAKAKELGVISDDELLELSHIVRAADDPMRTFDKENVFWSMYKQNRDRMREQKPIPGFEEWYEGMMGDRIKGYYGYDQGGIVNGYAGGGLIKKLLQESIGMMSRRKFMKGTGAMALSAALPKSAMKLAAPAAKKAALSYAPPWVNGMLSALKDVPITAKTVFRMGNEAKVHKIGSNKIKLYGGKTGTETHFRVKPSDEVMADDMITKDLGKIDKDDFNQLEAWDDIVLREEPGETTITWKNKHYDHGNDQHIVIDKINKETRFVDDNWHMEAGGEDIAKDDWLEYSISPKAINEATASHAKLGPGEKLADDLVDYYSVNDMDNTYSGMFQSYVDSFSPTGKSIFGTVERMKKYLNKPSLTQQHKKKIDKMQKSMDKYTSERDMAEWEEQFRGGHGMHGYKRGGMPGRREKLQPRITPKFKPPRSDIRPKAKPGTYWPTPDNMDMNRLLNSMAHVESRGDPFAIGPPIKGRTEKAHGMYQILPSTARDPGYNVTPWDNFSNEWKSPSKQREFAQNYIQGLVNYYDGDWQKAISQYGGDSTSNYWNKIMHTYGGYNKGGLVKEKKFTVDDAVAMINANPQNFAGGGIVKKFAPKVIGKLTKYATRARPSKARLYKPPKGPYTITDESGVRILDREFQTLGGAKIALDDLAILRTQDASTFKIFGKRPPKTKEGAWEPAPEVNLGMVGKKIKIAKGTKYGDPDKPGAIFWGSREKIIGAPKESMTGQQWLDYLLKDKHGIINPKGYRPIKHAELNDTSLAPFLSKYKNKVIPKKVLVDSFDRIAPKMDVKVAGREVKTEMMDKYLNALKGIDPQSYREPQAGFYRYLKSTEDKLKRGMQPDADAKYAEEAESILQSINRMVDDIYGVPNVLEEGFPQRFPFKLKNMINQLSSASGKRVTGLKSYAGEPQYAATQTLGGGENPRELLFKYTPGAMRKGEPVYKYAHGFSGIPEAEGKNAFVHMRMSDRTDEYGRRILFIEEIQSDMHQPIRQAQKYVKRMTEEGKPPMPGELAKSRYAQRGDVPVPVSASDKVNEDQFKLIVAKIEDLGAQPQTVATQKRIAKLNRERKKIRKILDASKKKVAKDTSGVPQGPYSKTEDYNEFVIKYATKMAQEGGYDGVSVASPAIKNRGLRPTDESFGGNLIAYGPIAKDAMKKVAKKSGAKFLKTSIMDDKGVAWEVPIIWLDRQSKYIVSKGLPAYKRGGIAING